MECPICCDDFIVPKLLSCRHTFCRKCLKDYANKTKIKNFIKCPLCRHQSYISNGCVDSLVENFFITSSCLNNNSDDSDKCLDEVSRPETALEGNFSEDSDEDLTVPFSLTLLAGNIQTKFKATFVSAFSTGEERCINSVHPVSEKEAWTISNCGPDLALFNIHGQELKRIPLPGKFCDMICRENDILIAMPEDCKVGRVSILNSKFSDFALTGNCRIGNMSSFPDGSIVIVGQENVDVKSGGRDKIQIFSKYGEYLSGHAKNNNDFDPFAVAVNPVVGTFSVVDSKRRCVYTLFRNGDILNIYNGGKNMFPLSPNLFIPLGICYDSDGNLIIADGGSDTLHVLNSWGRFLGLVLTNHDDGFGEPFSIAVDKEGKLWIGDINNGMIRVFKISSFINELGRDEN